MTWQSNRRRRGIGFVTLLIALVLLCSSVAKAFGGSPKKVLLRDVQTLTLHRDRMTTGRRTRPVPQLSCTGGSACGDYEPEVVQCINAGFDGTDVQWKCEADLPDNMRFGELDVYCEGYNHPDDPYVLKGSCGLEYKLHYTNKFSSHYGSWSSSKFNQWASKGRNDDAPPPYRPPGSGPHGGGGGGGGGGWGSGWGSGWGNNDYRYKPTGSEGFRPGFWSGLGLGGLATYLATNRDRQRNYYPGYNTGYSSFSQPSTSYGSYSGGWGAGPSSASSSSSSSRPTRSATGYGGTRRR
ncbi:hypothetical protein BX616_009797 [Lobosporangium transversale]|nr:hypothetical protein BX616_009797 [Lobosporangium transversale]